MIEQNRQGQTPPGLKSVREKLTGGVHGNAIWNGKKDVVAQKDEKRKLKDNRTIESAIVIGIGNNTDMDEFVSRYLELQLVDSQRSRS